MLGKVVEVFLFLENLLHCIESVSCYDEVGSGKFLPCFFKQEEGAVRVIKKEDVLELAEVEYHVGAVLVCKFVGKQKDLLNLCVSEEFFGCVCELLAQRCGVHHIWCGWKVSVHYCIPLCFRCGKMGYNLVCKFEHKGLYAPYVEKVYVTEGDVFMVMPEQFHGVIYQRLLSNFCRSVYKYIVALPYKIAQMCRFLVASYELGA